MCQLQIAESHGDASIARRRESSLPELKLEVAGRRNWEV